MQRLIAAVLLLAALVGGSFWSCRAAQRVTDDISRELTQGQAETAYARWLDAQPLLGSLLPHDELDDATRLFERVLAAEAEQTADEGRLDRAELLTQLHHLPEMLAPSWKNVF